MERGTYWEEGVEKEVSGWTMRLPDGREFTERSRSAQGTNTSGGLRPADGEDDTMRLWRQSNASAVKCQLIRLIDRVPILGPEQLRRAMGLAISGILGFYARSTPIPWSTCKEIEAVRAEVLQRRGICPAAPRLPIFAPCEAGGLGHVHTYQIAASAFIDQIDRMVSSGEGVSTVSARQALSDRRA